MGADGQGFRAARRRWPWGRAGRGLAAATAVAALALPASPASATSAEPCPNLCGEQGGPELIALQPVRGDSVRVRLLLARGGPSELVLVRAVGGSLARADLAVINQSPREVLSGRFPVGYRPQTVARARLRPLRAGVHSVVVALRGGKGSPPAGIYVLRANAITPAGKLRARGSSVVVRVRPDGSLLVELQPHRTVAPSAFTNRASSVTQLTATLSGKVVSGGQRNTYYFQFGPTAGYGAQTPSQSTRSRPKVVHVSGNLNKLSLATTYHYRLVATNCGGCTWGTAYGQDRTLTTLDTTGLPPWQADADRAVATYNAMQQYLYTGDGSGLYLQSYPVPTGARSYSFLWPFSRALDGTIALAGVPPALLGGANYQAALDDRLMGLSRYWDGSSTGPGYDSYPPAPYGTGGDKYYDDQGWIGLALAQTARLTGNQTALGGAESVFNFVFPGGWAGAASFEPGGVYWVQQGVGVGATNHDRTTNSTAPNAELALLLENLNPANASSYDAVASGMYGWANHYLFNVAVNPTDPGAPNPNFSASQPPLMFDKVRGNGSIDQTLWTYNQGTMIAANVREYQKTGQPGYLADAETLASTALGTFNETAYLGHQPAAFNAIFFRGLLVLSSITGDASLRSRIIQTIQTYADDAWNGYRSSQGLFRFPSSPASSFQLLDQGAMLEIYAMLAWNPADYGKLP